MHNNIPMDFMSNEDFCAQRAFILPEIIALKKARRVFLGRDISMVFESSRLIWWQIQEMLRSEQGGPEQLQEEWDVYQSLIPNEHFLTATMMIEINDPIARKKTLGKRIGIEREFFLEGAGFRTQSQPVDGGKQDMAPLYDQGHHEDVDMDDGGHGQGDSDVATAQPEEKTSSVHFLRFPLDQGARKALALGEPVLSCQNRDALSRAPIARSLWVALCHDVGIVPVKY
jgi:hypothetical protein